MPVLLKVRHDGWTPSRQRHFIDVLAATRSIAKACKAVGMSRASAYKLRQHPEARQFRLAWNGALRPDFDRPRSASNGGTVGLRRLRRARKVDDVQEVHATPDSPGASQPTSSALATLQTYLALLREQEQQLGCAEGG